MRSQKSWLPIDRLACHDRSVLLLSDSRSWADRSAIFTRSIGKLSGFRCLCFKLLPIDRLINRDRSASSLPFVSHLCNSCRSIGCYAAIERRWLCLSIHVFLCSKMFRFVYFFSSVSVLVLKSPVHSQNSLNNIYLRNLTYNSSLNLRYISEYFARLLACWGSMTYYNIS